MGCLQTKSSNKVVADIPRHSITPVFGLDHILGEVITEDVVKKNKRKQKKRRRKKKSNSKKESKTCVQCEERALEENVRLNGDKSTKRQDSRITAKYSIKALIGEGTFSRVVRVENRVSKQPYAMKIIECREGRAVFEAELSILRRVRHPNVVQLVEVLETDDRVYLVMELATGGDLFDKILARGCFSEIDAIRVLKMVLEGVKYLHELGVSHRDLKPDNILYYHPGSDSKIIVTDFGLACSMRLGGDVYMYTACGTPEYIAPEVVARKPYTKAVDMWAIGVISFILLAGAFPFDDDNTTRLYKKILRVSYSLQGKVWQGVSVAARDFISRLLVADPLHRLSASAALRHPWITQPQHRTSISSKASSRSSHSSSSRSSLRSSMHRRVTQSDLDSLDLDPEACNLARSFPSFE